MTTTDIDNTILDLHVIIDLLKVNDATKSLSLKDRCELAIGVQRNIIESLRNRVYEDAFVTGRDGHPSAFEKIAMELEKIADRMTEH